MQYTTPLGAGQKSAQSADDRRPHSGNSELGTRNWELRNQNSEIRTQNAEPLTTNHDLPTTFSATGHQPLTTAWPIRHSACVIHSSFGFSALSFHADVGFPASSFIRISDFEFRASLFLCRSRVGIFRHAFWRTSRNPRALREFFCHPRRNISTSNFIFSPHRASASQLA